MKRVKQKILLDSFLILSLKNDFIRRVDIPQGGDEHVRQFDAVLVEILVAVVAMVMPFLPRIRTSHLDIIYQLAVCVIFSRNVESVEIVEFAMLTVKSFVASRAFVMPFRSILHTGCGNSGYKVAVSIPRHRDNRAFRFVSTVDLQDFSQIH